MLTWECGTCVHTLSSETPTEVHRQVRNSNSNHILWVFNRISPTPTLVELTCVQTLQLSSHSRTKATIGFTRATCKQSDCVTSSSLTYHYTHHPPPDSLPHPSLIQLLISPLLVPDGGNPLSSNKDPATPPQPPQSGRRCTVCAIARRN